MRRVIMPKRGRSDEELRERVRSPGFQPGRGELDSLLGRLAGDEEAAEAAERAAARLGMEAARAAIARQGGARAPERGRLVRLVGRVAQATRAAELRQFLVGALADPDAKSRRNAIIALGKLGGDGVEEALVAAWDREPDVAHRRSLAAALGKVGGARARERLAGVQTEDPELRRIVDEARLKLARTIDRALEPGAIDATRRSPGAVPVWLHCRRGLESFVTDELEKISPRASAPGRVEATLDGSLDQLFRSRAMLRFGFPLPVAPGAPLDEAVVGALASDQAAALMRAFTVGAPRYRLEWASGGHRRGLTFRCAQAVAARRPELVNDPTESLWEAVVADDGPTVELWPRGLADPRFDYRVEQVPASSHPTLAAALARLAGARAGDVVWDPFVGAGTELVERARLGPFSRLVGSDLDEAALARARANLAAAGVAGAELLIGDARAFEPGRVTLIVTNPPMGRRVLNKTLTGALFDQFLEHAARVLVPGGRLVWISPRPDATVERARQVGLRSTFRRRVDMGGFSAELQSFTRERANSR